MAATAQPLYTLNGGAFDNAISSLASRALPGFSVGFRGEAENGSLVPLKRLPDALASSGPAGSCSNCHLNVLEGCTAGICLVCGTKSYASALVSPLLWSGSVAQQRFLQSIPSKEQKTKRRSSRANESPLVSPTSNFLEGNLESPSAFPLDGSRGSNPGSDALRAKTGSPDSPWDATLDTSAANQMNVFSLADVAMEMEKNAGKPGTTSRDANALDDFFAQLGSLPEAAQQKRPSQETQKPAASVDPAVQKVLNRMPDLSFLLADRLVVPEKDPGKFSPQVLQAVMSSACVVTAGSAAEAYANSFAAGLAAIEDEEDDEWGDFET